MSDLVTCWWVSNEKMTLLIRTENGIIKEAPPVASKFVGQPLDNLACWMEKMCPTTVKQLRNQRV